jgi:hypothetical protein
MVTFSGLIGLVGLASVLYALYILNQLSRKLGAVTKMPPYFRGFYVAAVLGACAFLARIIRTSAISASGVANPELAWAREPLFAVLGYHLPLAVAMTISVAIAWRYWSWLWQD